MSSALRVYLLAAILFTFGSRTTFGLDIVLDVDGVGSVAITDNLSGDSNATVGIIDFNETFGGQFQAEGRVEQFFGPIARIVGIAEYPQ